MSNKLKEFIKNHKKLVGGFIFVIVFFISIEFFIGILTNPKVNVDGDISEYDDVTIEYVDKSYKNSDKYFKFDLEDETIYFKIYNRFYKKHYTKDVVMKYDKENKVLYPNNKYGYKISVLDYTTTIVTSYDINDLEVISERELVYLGKESKRVKGQYSKVHEPIMYKDMQIGTQQVKNYDYFVYFKDEKMDRYYKVEVYSATYFSNLYNLNGDNKELIIGDKISAKSIEDIAGNSDLYLYGNGYYINLKDINKSTVESKIKDKKLK